MTKMIPEKTRKHQEPLPAAKGEESCGGVELKATRTPQRKYIRKEGMPGQQKIVVEVVQQKPKEISVASLKEKFGLSDSKIGGKLRSNLSLTGIFIP